MTEKNRQVRDKTEPAKKITSNDKETDLAPPADPVAATPAVPTAMLTPEEPNGPGAKG
ncbi:hypothetical protein [Pseudoduganella lutea]|uniref:hypothetical protein n=1 Tax=Pseudoduganella lutea TaxID=321985 RepID=UPI0013EE6077|nr:hypothetical protein [Pseudoduganella lutea]